MLVVDKVLWPLAAQFVDRVGFEHVIAVGAGDTPEGAVDYEELLASAEESEFEYRDIDERAAAAMCFTSGTTGKPKGVVYSHRAIAIHALTAGSLLGVTEGDTVLPVVPMFHANAWCFPFSCTLVGAKQVFPGPHLDPQSLLDAFESEHVTEIFTGFGAVGVRAETVAESAVREARRYLAADVPVGPYLADQLLLPLALAGGGAFRTLPLSRHATTNIEVIRAFLGTAFAVTRVDDTAVEVAVR